MESGVEFVAADMPKADRFTLHIFAALAEQEARMISTRTKAALAAAKARGVQLGNPHPEDEARGGSNPPCSAIAGGASVPHMKAQEGRSALRTAPIAAAVSRMPSAQASHACSARPTPVAKVLLAVTTNASACFST